MLLLTPRRPRIRDGYNFAATNLVSNTLHGCASITMSAICSYRAFIVSSSHKYYSDSRTSFVELNMKNTSHVPWHHKHWYDDIQQHAQFTSEILHLYDYIIRYQLKSPAAFSFQQIWHGLGNPSKYRPIMLAHPYVGSCNDLNTAHTWSQSQFPLVTKHVLRLHPCWHDWHNCHLNFRLTRLTQLMAHEIAKLSHECPV